MSRVRERLQANFQLGISIGLRLMLVKFIYIDDGWKQEKNDWSVIRSSCKASDIASP